VHPENGTYQAWRKPEVRANLAASATGDTAEVGSKRLRSPARVPQGHKEAPQVTPRGDGSEAVAGAGGVGGGVGKSKGFECRVCGEVFVSRNALFRHMHAAGHQKQP
jgi:hypothetical protein